MSNDNKTLEKALNVMSYLSDKAEEKDFLKRIPVFLTCTVLSDSVEKFYKSGAKTGELRGHQVNLCTDKGGILPDILLNEPVGRGETVDVEVSLLIPDSFLEGKVVVANKAKTSSPLGSRTVSPEPPKP